MADEGGNHEPMARKNNEERPRSKSTKKAEELQAYKNTMTLPDYVSPNQIKVDMENQCVILPICGNPVPFHISTIKDVVLTANLASAFLKIKFYTDNGMAAVGKYCPANTAKLVQKYAPYATFIREMTFRMSDNHSLTTVFHQISELHKRARTEELQVQNDSKRRRLEDNHDFLASIESLSGDVLANIFGFLRPVDTMRVRLNRKMREAAEITIVPPTDFRVDSVDKYNAMNSMTRVLPNLQQITLCCLQMQHKYSDGEDPDEEEAARTANYTTHDIELVSNFRNLRIFEINSAYLNGRYPFLFNSSSFPQLQKLSLICCRRLKWDLGMLAGLPLLKELTCEDNLCLTGNISSLRVLKDTLQKVAINNCENVEGNLMDLADFPLLKELDLEDTAVTGDIRDIGDNDFSSLELLILPKGLYGGRGYEFHRISDGPDLINEVYLLKEQRPALKMKGWYGVLSRDSLDWYERADEDWYDDSPPFCIVFVQAGSRIGYRWETENCDPCEVIWLNQEPDRESSDYAKYTKELQLINSCVNMYRGFHQPPIEEEYGRLMLERIKCDLCGCPICDFPFPGKCDQCGIQTCGNDHNFRVDICSYCEEGFCPRCHDYGLPWCDGCEKRSCMTGNCEEFKFCNGGRVAFCSECYVEEEESEEEDFEDEDGENGEMSG